jgi:hypothetical protein
VLGASHRHEREIQIPSLKLEEAEYLRVQKKVDDGGRAIKMTKEPSLPAQGISLDVTPDKERAVMPQARHLD